MRSYQYNFSRCASNNQTTNPSITKKYYCDDNYKINGDKCIISSSDIIDATVTKNYYCKAGYELNGTTCYKENNNYVTPNRVTNTKACPDGYTKVNDGNQNLCVKYNTTTIEPTKKTKTVTKDRYKWSTSYVLDGWVNTGKTRETKVASSK